VGARLDGLTIDIDRAGAAVAGLAANVCAREMEFFAQKVDQQGARFNGFFFFLAVD
jgi:hypothetical protein